MSSLLEVTDFDYYADEVPDPLYEALMAGDTGEQVTTLEALLARPAWQQHAACRGVGPDAFFPERGQATDPAKALCATCPVADECLDAGLDEFAGIWGGTSGKQRKNLRRTVSPDAKRPAP